ncbi:unnamed protein product [Caretta caretta]
MSASLLRKGLELLETETETTTTAAAGHQPGLSSPQQRPRTAPKRRKAARGPGRNKTTAKGKVTKSAIEEYRKHQAVDHLKKNLQYMTKGRFTVDKTITQQARESCFCSLEYRERGSGSHASFTLETGEHLRHRFSTRIGAGNLETAPQRSQRRNLKALSSRRKTSRSLRENTLGELEQCDENSCSSRLSKTECSEHGTDRVLLFGMGDQGSGMIPLASICLDVTSNARLHTHVQNLLVTSMGCDAVDSKASREIMFPLLPTSSQHLTHVLLE